MMMKTILALLFFSFSCSVFGKECEYLIVTTNTYAETEDLEQKVKVEFGEGYSVADWTDLEAISDLDTWISCMGLTNGQQMMITRNGKFFYGTNRQYFFGYYSGGSAPAGFLVHASIKNKLFLGSWYGITMHVLAKNNNPDNNKACEYFKITANSYSETEKLNQKVMEEFGNEYSIADWTDLQAISDLDAWISCMGLTNGQQMMITRNGNYFYGTNRQYFFGYYSGGSAPAGFLVHASIGNKLFLGSWYGISMHVLAKKDAVTHANSIKTNIPAFFPNPVHDIIFINNDYSEFEGCLYSVDGSLKISFKNESILNVSDFDPGIYLLVLIDHNRKNTYKLLKH